MSSEQMRDPCLDEEPVILKEIPRLYALYRAEEEDELPAGVVAWVVELPEGRAAVLKQGTVIMSPSLDQVARRWAALECADLVAVAVGQSI